MTSLPEGIFDGLSNLQYLYLDRNQLEKLSADIFTGLANLWFIDFRDNPISVLPSDREITVASGSSAVWMLSPGEMYSEILLSEHRLLQVAKGGSAQFKVRLLNHPPGDAEVRVQSDDDSKATVSPEILHFGSRDWDTGKTVTVSVPQDVDNAHESVTVTLSMDGTDPREVRITVVDAEVASITGVCDRTQQVQDEIVRQTPGISDCADITLAHLEAITSLDLSDKGISALQSGDFAGFASLRELDLSDNRLETLPEDIFHGLVDLQWLYLYDNHLASSPVDIFDGLANLEELYLDRRHLETLPPNVFH